MARKLKLEKAFWVYIDDGAKPQLWINKDFHEAVLNVQIGEAYLPDGDGEPVKDYWVLQLPNVDISIDADKFRIFFILPEKLLELPPERNAAPGEPVKLTNAVLIDARNSKAPLWMRKDFFDLITTAQVSEVEYRDNSTEPELNTKDYWSLNLDRPHVDEMSAIFGANAPPCEPVG